jgi:hypothetical protein
MMLWRWRNSLKSRLRRRSATAVVADRPFAATQGSALIFYTAVTQINDGGYAWWVSAG